MKSYFVDNGDVKIHVLENEVPRGGVPSLLVIGGLWEPAERAIPLLSGLSSHAVAFSFRGRGLSSTPESGYDLAGHLSDIEAVVRYCGLADYCALGFSRGASYALGWSLERQKEMRGLILVDQPPLHVKPGPGYVEHWSNLVYLGVPILNFMRRAALQGLEWEAEDVDFSPRLPELKIPVAFFAGTNEHSNIPSNVTADDIRLYQQAVPQLKLVEFKESGHMIPDVEQPRYIAETASFLASL